MHDIKNATEKDIKEYCDLVTERVTVLGKATWNLHHSLKPLAHPSFKSELEELMASAFAVFAATGNLKTLVPKPVSEQDYVKADGVELKEPAWAPHLQDGLEEKASKAIAAARRDGFNPEEEDKWDI